LVFFGKLDCLIAGFIVGARDTAAAADGPMMNFAWKFMLPMALVNLFAAGICTSCLGRGAMGGLRRISLWALRAAGRPLFENKTSAKRLIAMPNDSETVHHR